MYRISITLLFMGLLFSCSNDGNKVTYYEPHDNCEMMKIMDTSMVTSKIKFTGDPDYDLALILKTHHAGGIEMEEMVLKEGKDPAMKKIAERLLQDDKERLARIDSFLNKHIPHKITPTLPDDAMKAMDKMQHTCDLQIIKDDIDHDFGILILPHRQSGVDLAEIVLDECDDPTMVAIAEDIRHKSDYQFEALLTWLLKFRATVK